MILFQINLQSKVEKAAVSGNLDAPEGTFYKIIQKIIYLIYLLIFNDVFAQVALMQLCKQLCAVSISVGVIKLDVCLCSQLTLVSIMLAMERCVDFLFSLRYSSNINCSNFIFSWVE